LSSQHSQALEANYAHFPGLKVIAPGTPADAKGLLKSAIRDENPVVFMEAELLYGFKGEVPEGEYVIPIGKADIKREGSDVTLITWSRMLTAVVLPAAQQLADAGINVEVLDLRTIKPMDEEAIAQSVKKTNRVVIVEEGWGYAGFGGHISDFIHRELFDDLDAPVQRVHGLDVNMAYAENLERLIQPSVPRVIEAVNKVLYR
jgi:pyruvate dehydrogenase E1 component beta subunit